VNVAQVKDVETETTPGDPDPLELGIAYTALLFMGAGKFSLDRRFGLR